VSSEDSSFEKIDAAAEKLGKQLSNERLRLLKEGKDLPLFQEAVDFGRSWMRQKKSKEGCLAIPCVGKISHLMTRLKKQRAFQNAETMGILCMAYQTDAKTGMTACSTVLWIADNKWHSFPADENSSGGQFSVLPSKLFDELLKSHQKMPQQLQMLPVHINSRQMPTPQTTEEKECAKYCKSQQIQVIPFKEKDGSLNFRFVKQSKASFWGKPTLTTYVDAHQQPVELDWRSVGIRLLGAQTYCDGIPLENVPNFFGVVEPEIPPGSPARQTTARTAILTCQSHFP
jgi:hypothetical protein